MDWTPLHRLSAGGAGGLMLPGGSLLARMGAALLSGFLHPEGTAADLALGLPVLAAGACIALGGVLLFVRVGRPAWRPAAWQRLALRLAAVAAFAFAGALALVAAPTLVWLAWGADGFGAALALAAMLFLLALAAAGYASGLVAWRAAGPPAPAAGASGP